MKLQEPCPAGSNTGSLLSSLSQGVQGYIALVSTSVYPRSTLRQAAWGVRQGLGTTTRKKAACPGRGSHVPWWPLGPCIRFWSLGPDAPGLWLTGAPAKVGELCLCRWFSRCPVRGCPQPGGCTWHLTTMARPGEAAHTGKLLSFLTSRLPSAFPRRWATLSQASARSCGRSSEMRLVHSRGGGRSAERSGFQRGRSRRWVSLGEGWQGSKRGLFQGEAALEDPRM